jgi:phage-related minor tail protein
LQQCGVLFFIDFYNGDYMANITLNKQKEELSGIKNQLKQDILELKGLDEYILNLTEGYVKDKYISEKENLLKTMADLLETGKALDLQIKNSMQMGALGRGFGGGYVERVNVPTDAATRQSRDKIEQNVSNAVGSPAGSTDSLKEFLVTQRTAIDLLKLEGQAATMTASQYAQLKTDKEFEGQLDKLKISQSGKVSQAFLDEAEGLKKAKIAAVAYNEEFKHTFAGGIQEGLKAVAEQAQDVGGAIKSAMTDAFKGAEDAFVSFVQTGKLDFKSLMDSVIADLARAQFRSMASSLFGGSGGFNIGNIFSNLFGGSSNFAGHTGMGPFLPAFASGTDSAPGGFALVGENGPELVNLPRGSSVTPNNKLNQGGQTVIVNQTFTANANARELAAIAGQIKNETVNAVYQSFSRGTLKARVA